jgi:exopolysaccharide biosynthesis polyprenyl glycosylphosphotransferase
LGGAIRVGGGVAGKEGGFVVIVSEQVTMSGALAAAKRDAWKTALLTWDFACAVGFLLVPIFGYRPASASVWSDAGLLLTGVLSVGLLDMLGAYEPVGRLPGARMRTCGNQILVGCATAVAAGFVSTGFSGQVQIKYLVLTTLVLPVPWIAARVGVSVLDRLHPARTLVIGTGVTACHVWELSLRHHECAFEVVGFVDDDPLTLPPGAPATLGDLADLPQLVEEQKIRNVIVAYANMSDADLLGIIRALDGRVRIQVIPRLFDVVQARGFELGRISVLEAGGLPQGAGERFLKRGLDIVVASVALVLISPLLAMIAIAIKLDDHGPVLFRQRRVGRYCKTFSVLKFRTMTARAEEDGREIIQGLPIEAAVHELKSQSGVRHVTRVGRVLRAKSLDELPQLWNVISGDMGLVGPRPLREYEIAALDEWQVTARQAVRPGITGLWQVSGRSSVSWDERVHLDCGYARHWSLTSDISILARTVAVVLHRSNTA